MARAATCLVILVTSLLAAAAHPARAALTSEQGRCQRGAAAAGEKYLKSTAAILAKCHDAIAAGKLVAADCRLETESAEDLAKAVLKLDTKLTSSCPTAVLGSLIFGDDCHGVTTAVALGACIRSNHNREVDEIIAALYATSGELPADPRKCQATASKQTRAFAVARMKALRSCRNGAGKDKLAPRKLCGDEPITIEKLAKKRAKSEPKIADACGAGPLAGLDFGAPCADPADAAALTECLFSLASDSGDAASLALYGEGGFCGDAYQGVDGKVAALIADMTLEEKAEQMHGSLPLPQNDVWATPVNERLDIPGFGMIDGPRGVSKIADNATAFPVGIARGAAWDPELEERVGEAMAVEARAKGASVLLAPVTEVVRHPRWGRSQESYGEDPFHLGRMGVAFVNGAQRHVIASVKHFALNSIEDTRLTVSANVDERSLREIYLPPFRDVVEEADVGSVMSAYNRVNGLYCAENPHLLTDILKGDWEFRGFVESDWIQGMHSTIESALAGLDLEMPFAQYYGPALETAVNNNDVPEATVDDAVRRILRAKFCFRLDTEPPVVDPGLVETPEHIALALESARAGIVLLKNDGPVLPLDRGTLTSIAVVGPLADLENIGDDGSSDVEPSSVVTALEGIADRAGAVSVIHVTDPDSPAGQNDISTADAAIVVVGFTEADEGEQGVSAGDRDTYSLPAAQEQLISDVAALNPSTIVVLEGGSAIGVESWIDDVEGLFMAWYPGMEGGNAIGDLLFGDVNPSGKLPLVVAKLESDLPPFLNAQDDVTYDYYFGYRLLDRDGIDPRFPFGYGLSYTTYSYSNLAVEDATLAVDETLQVTFDVTNSGSVAGDEVAQLYVSYTGSAVDRPALDLKGFARVHLEPAETKSVSIEVPAEKLAYYDTGTSAWVVETITYGVHVGSSSRDLPLSTSFMVQ